jgi:hypothetical protein
MNEVIEESRVEWRVIVEWDDETTPSEFLHYFGTPLTEETALLVAGNLAAPGRVGVKRVRVERRTVTATFTPWEEATEEWQVSVTHWHRRPQDVDAPLLADRASASHHHPLERSVSTADVATRALTMKQPWASLIMARTPDGGCLKPVENRTWPVPSTLPEWLVCDMCGRRRRSLGRPCSGACHPDGPFPFRLGIHAGKDFDQAGFDRLPLTRAVQNVVVAGFLRGALLGSVLVTGCHDSTDCMKPDGLADAEGLYHDWRFCSPWANGDDGVWHWTLTDPQPLPEPIPMCGHQRLWTLPMVTT